MTKEYMQKLLDSGEGFTIEYKKNESKLSSDVFETVSSFSNRYGGHILLGVIEIEKDGRKIGKVSGVDKDRVYDMKRDFVNILNNPTKFNPTLYLELEEFDYDGLTVLWTYVPPMSQVCYCDRKVYDRNNESDQDITNKNDRIAEIITRKSSDYREQTILPYAKETHLKMELMDYVRKLVIGRNKEHPWRNMDDMEIMRSAGLYVENIATGESGFNLAAILLFGKPEVIKTCVPGYKTDAIYRVENTDRYDDRDIIEDNLIEAYDKLMAFCMKHMDNRFVLDKDISVDARELIAREVISNILIHRDYSNAFPAKLIIENDVLRTENWSKSRFNGPLSIDTFSPYPKNPLLASFFVNIGRADTLGSGMRNLYKYTRLYSNSDPMLSEGDIFEIRIPLKKSDINLQKSDIESKKSGISLQKSDIENEKLSEEYLMQKCKQYSYNITVLNNMRALYASINTNQIFGASDIERILGCARSTASDIIKRMRDMNVVVSVSNHGKGKYRLINKNEIL
ncbi:MAG: putative DNA binding domain-containing protein [Lachnospiraceae bacterium]|nr:putative DNA binding domain-containing protein [Lachnospiraceae bacterium]